MDTKVTYRDGDHVANMIINVRNEFLRITTAVERKGLFDNLNNHRIKREINTIIDTKGDTMNYKRSILAQVFEGLHQI